MVGTGKCEVGELLYIPEVTMNIGHSDLLVGGRLTDSQPKLLVLCPLPCSYGSHTSHEQTTELGSHRKADPFL